MHTSPDELKTILRQADPTVLLVRSRLLRRLIKKHRGLGGLGLRVPHHDLYLISRNELLAISKTWELRVSGGECLPEQVLLLPIPENPRRPQAEILRDYWRLLFHAAVDRSLSQLTESEAKNRVGVIGNLAFEEAREVLRQQNLLFDPESEREVYVEFAAKWLELELFEPRRLGAYFPAILDPQAINNLLAKDIDGEQVCRKLRPQGAAEPAPPPDEKPTPPPPPKTNDPRYPGMLRKRAEKAAAIGNFVRAAVLRFQAIGRMTFQTGRLRSEARADLGRLTDRLQQALKFAPSERSDWHHCLMELLETAAYGWWNVEQRLLYDLQKICTDTDPKREIHAVDVAEWFVSWFQHPIKRKLPDQPLVLTVKHLRSALKRLPRARMREAEHNRLREMLQAALARTELTLRDRLKPRLTEALNTVGLKPANPAEELSRDRIVDELLDLVVARGFLTLADLRDSLARSRVKLQDLVNPIDLVTGDPLLKLNSRLAFDLDGIYHRGELYTRLLQQISSLFFGNLIGRTITLYFLLPLLGAFFILKGTNVLMEEMHKFLYWPTVLVHKPGIDADYESGILEGPPRSFLVRAPEIWDLHHYVLSSSSYEYEFAGYSIDISSEHLFELGCYFLMTVFLLLMIHIRRFRGGVLNALHYVWIVLRALLYDIPRAFLRLPIVRAILQSKAWVLFWLFVAKPAMWVLPIAFILWRFGMPWDLLIKIVAGLFVATSVFLNSPWGVRLQEILGDSVIMWWHLFREDFLPGVFNFIIFIFRRVMERIDQLLYTVDEMLRFRTGDSYYSLVIKAVLGLVWFVVTYVIRFALVVLIEPQVNPIKHFPVVTVGHKLSLLLLPALVPIIATAFRVPTELAGTLAFAFLALIPGFYGFLAWELKENWRLYRANQSPTIDPEMVGDHGECVVNFLRPGFHSGTLPKLYAKLREAEGSAKRNAEQGIHHVEEAMKRFIERELINVLKASKGWAVSDTLAIGHVDLATNRIRVELCLPGLDPENMLLDFELHGSVLEARIAEPGWISALRPQQKATLANVLAALYKKAGVERVCGQDLAARPLAWTQWVEVLKSDREGTQLPALPGIDLLPGLNIEGSSSAESSRRTLDECQGSAVS